MQSQEAADRYIPGPVSAAVQALNTDDDHGFFSVGADGVLRSFAGNGTVLDYHQLDPDQLASFAASQLAAWEASGMPVPASVANLANSASAVDGRLVTDLDQLLDPADRPVRSSAVKERDIDDLAIPAKRQGCVGTPCQSLPDCLVIGCAACFFPGGPPLGVCFFS